MRTSEQLTNTVFVAIALQQAPEREPDRCNVIAALAIAAYIAHLYCRSARARSARHHGAALAIGEEQASSGDVPRSRLGRRPSRRVA